jgi:threonine dehydrogenase-like Zn-dependent dehydrogenase
VIPDHLEDEKVLFLTDILSTGWMAADQATVEQGDTIVVWGAGPVGLFAAQSRAVMGAEQVIVIDHYPHRLELARQLGCLVIDYQQTNVLEALMEMTGGQGPDAVIDAVGMESHGFMNFNPVDTLKQKVGIGVDRIGALRQAIFAVRKGGRVSVPGVYGGFSDKFPTGALMEKGLTLRTGQTHVQRYHKELLRRIEEGEIDTTFLISTPCRSRTRRWATRTSPITRTNGPRSCSSPNGPRAGSRPGAATSRPAPGAPARWAPFPRARR